MLDERRPQRVRQSARHAGTVAFHDHVEIGRRERSIGQRIPHDAAREIRACPAVSRHASHGLEHAESRRGQSAPEAIRERDRGEGGEFRRHGAQDAPPVAHDDEGRPRGVMSSHDGFAGTRVDHRQRASEQPGAGAAHAEAGRARKIVAKDVRVAGDECQRVAAPRRDERVRDGDRRRDTHQRHVDERSGGELDLRVHVCTSRHHHARG